MTTAHLARLHLVVRFCAAFLAIAGASAIAAAPGSSDRGDWHYVSAYGGTTPWKVRQGVGSVKMHDGRLVITILDQRKRIIERTSGAIVASRVSATRALPASDIGPEPFTGTCQRLVDGATVYEVITLSNEYGFIGLNRITRAARRR